MIEDVERPLPDPEVHAVTAADGWILRVFDYRPAEPARGVVVAGHAMMVDARTLCRPDRPTLVGTLVSMGLRVLVPDQRGHGHSGPVAADGADWSYDDLVDDVGVYYELARELEPHAPVAMLGHSLYGHCSLAWAGQNPDANVRCLVMVACDVWNRRFEPRWRRWALKRAIFGFTRMVVGTVGYMPSRALRAGTADESPSYWLQFHSFVRRNRWVSEDGSVDYHRGMGEVSCPVLHVVSEGDRLYATPSSALSFSADVPERDVLVLGRDDAPGRLGEIMPTHMGIVTDPDSAPAWRAVGRWLLRQMAAG